MVGRHYFRRVFLKVQGFFGTMTQPIIQAKGGDALRDYLYHAYYCEENIRQLCTHPSLAHLPQRVIFITNAAKTCAVWNMRAAASPWEPVFWDYHVILAVVADGGWQIWDLDSLQGCPVPAPDYLENSFMPEMPGEFLPRFRVLEGETFQEQFSSDRRHMRAEDNSWLQPPPSWPAFCPGPHNLDRFINLADPIAGRIMDLTQLTHFLGAAPKED